MAANQPMTKKKKNRENNNNNKNVVTKFLPNFHELEAKKKKMKKKMTLTWEKQGNTPFSIAHILTDKQSTDKQNRLYLHNSIYMCTGCEKEGYTF